MDKYCGFCEHRMDSPLQQHTHEVTGKRLSGVAGSCAARRGVVYLQSWRYCAFLLELETFNSIAGFTAIVPVAAVGLKANA